MSTIKGIQAHWKHFYLEVLAMVKQLGLPTCFITLTCADFHWNELISMIAKLNRKNLLEEDIKNMGFFQYGNYLNINPILLVCHSQH